jgi:hypothetical protein
MTSLTLIEKLYAISNNSNTNLSSASMDFNALLTLASADNDADFEQQSFPDFSHVSYRISSALKALITTEQKWYFGYYTKLTIDRNNHQALANMLLAILSSSIVTADPSKQAAIIEQLINNKLYDQKEVYQAALQSLLPQLPYKQHVVTSIFKCILHSKNLTIAQQRELLAGNLDGRLSLNSADFAKLIEIVNNQETQGFSKLEIANILHSSINLTNTEKTELLAKLYPQKQKNLLTKFDAIWQQQEQSEKIAIFVKNSIIQAFVSNLPDINFNDLKEDQGLLEVKYTDGKNLVEHLKNFVKSINYDFENKKFYFQNAQELEINEQSLLDFLNLGVEKELKSTNWYTEDENQLTNVIGAVDNFLGTNFLSQKQKKETKGIFNNIKQYFIDMLMSVDNYLGYNFLKTQKSNILQEFNHASIELSEQIILELVTTKDNEVNYNNYKKLIDSYLAKMFEDYDKQEQRLKTDLKKSHPDHNKSSSKKQYYANKEQYDYFKIMKKQYRVLMEQLIQFHSYEKFLTVNKQKLTRINKELIVVNEFKPVNSMLKTIKKLQLPQQENQVVQDIPNRKEAGIDEVTMWLLKDGLDKLQLPQEKITNPAEYLFNNVLHCYKYNDAQLADYYKAAHPLEDVDPRGLSWMLNWFRLKFNDNKSYEEAGVYKNILELYQEKLLEIEQHNNKFDLKKAFKRYS